ncbi:MAG: response regulator containing CheY-like receiver, AAA-type ATPase, and DNA-binding domain protein [Halonotius sp. J07HN4]|nr:MAG: response regulator containing CheY-like receiver, AAA-type ATPase, and DNA-binding domain protein [Halonotius sp. J07HN4]
MVSYHSFTMGEGLTVAEPQVLMIDDEKQVADAYALRLEGVADVAVAYGGEEGLAVVDDGRPPDVVLLDRHMPGYSGDEVLAELREREIMTRVIMVTAIDPDLGIVEMPFDDYLSKPVDRDDLHAAVDQQCQVLAYELLGEYFRLASTRAVLTGEPAASADADQRLATIETEMEQAEQRVRALLPDAESLLSTFEEIDRGGY